MAQEPSEIEIARASLASDLASDTTRLAIKLAEERAVERERLENRLRTHEQRLDAVERTAIRVEGKLDNVDDGLQRLENMLRERDAVASAIQAKVKDAADRQVTTKTFVLGVLAVMLTIVVPVLSQVHIG